MRPVTARIQAMCIAEVSSAKSARVASGSSRSLLLGMAGGSSQPTGRYSRRSELTSGRTRNSAVGRTFTCHSVGVSASFSVDVRLLASPVRANGGDPRSNARQPGQRGRGRIMQGENPALATL